MPEDFVDQIRKNLIPKGSTVPHPVGWKGNNAKAGIKKPREIPASVDIIRSDKKIYRKKVDPRKAAALQYMLQGYSKHQAMIKAGYSKHVASKPTEWLSQKSIQSVIAAMQDKFVAAGIDADFIAKKMKEWLSAEKTIGTTVLGQQIKEPDYETQLKAFDRWKASAQTQDQQQAGTSRKITLEEFVWGGDKNAGDREV